MIRPAFIAAIFLTTACSRGGLNEDLAGVAVICNPQSCGTSWTIDGSGLLYAAAHVVKNWPMDKIYDQSTIRYFDTYEKPTVHYGVLELVYRNLGEDVAFIKPHMSPEFEFYAYRLCPKLHLFDDAFMVSAINDNTHYGESRKGILDFASGTVIALSKHRFSAAAIVEDGFSGGPMFVTDGEDSSCIGGAVTMARGLGHRYTAGPRVETIRKLYTQYVCPGCGKNPNSEIKFKQR